MNKPKVTTQIEQTEEGYDGELTLSLHSFASLRFETFSPSIPLYGRSNIQDIVEHSQSESLKHLQETIYGETNRVLEKAHHALQKAHHSLNWKGESFDLEKEILDQIDKNSLIMP